MGVISLSEVSIGLWGDKGVSAKESVSRSVMVYGLISIFLQVLEVWPVELHRKQVILPLVEEYSEFNLIYN